MNIQDLKIARNHLEKELLDLISEKVKAFNQETGAMVESVYVDFRTVDVLGGEREFFVNGVRVGVML